MQHRLKSLVALALLSTSVHAENIIGLRDLAGGRLVSFDSASPGTFTGEATITGLPTNSQPISIDFRPFNQSLVIEVRLERILPAAQMCRLFQVSVTALSASATPLGSADYTCTGGGEIDFNPTVDRVRNIAGSDSYRINPNGAGPGSEKTQDSAATYSGTELNATPGAAANIGGTAYDRNDTDGTTPTTLFAIDGSEDFLVRVGGNDGSPSPNMGEVNTIGTSGLGVNVGDVAFDISGITPFNAYMAATPLSGALSGISTFFTVNLTTGVATPVGRIGSASSPLNTNLLGMTAAPGIVLPNSGGVATDDGGGAFGQIALWLLAGLAGLRGVLAMRRR